MIVMTDVNDCTLAARVCGRMMQGWRLAQTIDKWAGSRVDVYYRCVMRRH